MAEYIEREALLKEICNSCDGYCDIVDCDCVNCKSDHRCDFVVEIADAPTADVVQVVRCKDCKHWDFGDCYRLELSHPYDFCSYGERKPKEAVSLVDGHIDKSNRCVSCGVEIPEGTWTCPSCDRRWQ